MAAKKELKYEVADNGCWVVTSHKPNPCGHVYIRINGKHTYLHRHVYEQNKGPIPENYVVRHTCDVPNCCNPDHLILGTQADNVRDRFERDRSAKGSKNGNAVLNEDIVREIKGSNLSITEISRQYGLDYGTVWCVKRNITWKHVQVEEVNR